MTIILQTLEKADDIKNSSSLVSYKNNVEVFKNIEVKQGQKTTTLIYYVGIDVDVAKLLEKEIV